MSSVRSLSAPVSSLPPLPHFLFLSFSYGVCTVTGDKRRDRPASPSSSSAACSSKGKTSRRDALSQRTRRPRRCFPHGFPPAAILARLRRVLAWGSLRTAHRHLMPSLRRPALRRARRALSSLRRSGYHTKNAGLGNLFSASRLPRPSPPLRPSRAKASSHRLGWQGAL